ncbi:uncharacterized protein LOC113304942 isoform X2 [Papaver somniferum]|uniref:uncharacterized protein LOC113304942 isoform X2 n=1 Tax=Papaver somniferum TaxID=3469 RepID=UPI000E6FF902|nr:uncharacterized protein LOC113304942 isoform X2 [Papaver somniferum]
MVIPDALKCMNRAWPGLGEALKGSIENKIHGMATEQGSLMEIVSRKYGDNFKVMELSKSTPSAEVCLHKASEVATVVSGGAWGVDVMTWQLYLYCWTAFDLAIECERLYLHEDLIYFQSNLTEATFSPPLSADPPEEKEKEEDDLEAAMMSWLMVRSLLLLDKEMLERVVLLQLCSQASRCQGHND